MLIPIELFNGAIIWMIPTKKTLVTMEIKYDDTWEVRLYIQGEMTYVIYKGEDKTDAFKEAQITVEKINRVLEYKGNKNA
jgi:hypothetical protein